MAQTGDPQGTGAGGSSLPDLPAEFSRETYKRGSIGAARTQNPDSANSQFFICYDGCRPLTGQYTLWGEVVEGMDTRRQDRARRAAGTSRRDAESLPAGGREEVTRGDAGCGSIGCH